MSEQQFDKKEYWRQYQAEKRKSEQEEGRKNLRTTIKAQSHLKLTALKNRREDATLADTIEWMIEQCAGDI